MLFLGIVGWGFNTWEMEKDTQVPVKPQQVCSLGGRRCPQDASSFSVCVTLENPGASMQEGQCVEAPVEGTQGSQLWEAACAVTALGGRGEE